MALFKGRAGRDDTFTGGTKADRFEFNPLDLNSGDTIVGGNGRAIDTLRFTSAGTIGTAALTHVSGIERIELGAGANAITLTDALVASANGALIEVVGGSGDDRVDASALVGTRAVTVRAGGGADVLLGGAGADLFDFAGGTLTAADTVTGGTGRDTIRFGDQAVISAEMLANVSQIEVLELGDAGSKIALVARLMSTANAILTVVGGAGRDTIDVGGLVTTGMQGSFVINAGAGDDVIKSTASPAGWLYLYSTIDGGAGADTIDLVNAGSVSVVYDGADRREVTKGGTLLVKGAAAINLTRNDQSLNDAALVQGFIKADASAATVGVQLTGAAANTLIGGAGNDVLTGGGVMIGGKGADTIRSSGAASVTLNEGDFARGESIIVKGGTLTVTGSVDFRIGTVRGFDSISVAGGDKRAVVQMSSALYEGIGGIHGPESVDVQVFVTDTKAHDFWYGQVGYNGLEIFGDAAANIISADLGDVRGGDGDDVLSGGQKVFGEAGDDRIACLGVLTTMDGGEGTDTLFAADYTQLSDVTIDLAKGDQTIGDSSTVRGFENVDLSAGRFGSAKVFGSDGANVLIGTKYGDVIQGRDGDDLIDGSAGVDRLTGGAGADTFRWLDRAQLGAADTLTDFTPGEDKMMFDEREYDVTGVFDQRLVTADARANIKGVDLLVYTGGRIDEPMALEDLFEGFSGGSAKEGMFVLVRDRSGDTILYHALSTGGSDLWDMTQVADFGKLDPDQIQLSDFAFI